MGDTTAVTAGMVIVGAIFYLGAEILMGTEGEPINAGYFMEGVGVLVAASLVFVFAVSRS